MNIRLFFLLLIVLTACKPEEPVKLPDNRKSREKLYREIVKDDEAMREFMKVAMESGKGKTVMEKEMEKDRLMKGDSTEALTRRLLQLCLGDTSYCSIVSSMMMENGQMMNTMMNNMHSGGIIDKDCLETGMQKVSEQMKD